MKNRVDANRLDHAADTAKFLVEHHDASGSYSVPEHWGPEGEIYRALCVWALVDAATNMPDEGYLATARNILQRFADRQHASGGWALSLGPDGSRFVVTAEERADSDALEDPVIAGAVLRAEAMYCGKTGDHQFRTMRAHAFEYVRALWNSEKGTIEENKDRHLSALRSNPEAYHFLVLSGLQVLNDDEFSGVADMCGQSARYVRSVFEAFDETTMPLMVGYHVALLLDVCSRTYAEDVLRTKLDYFIKAGRFHSSIISGGIGHRDGARGIVTDELHMRSAAGMAMAMKAYDQKMEVDYFTRLDTYREISSWIDSMKSEEGGYYEVQDEKDGRRFGKGAGGQYLPLFWILGTV